MDSSAPPSAGGSSPGRCWAGLLGEISPRAPFWGAAALSGGAFLYGLIVLPESLAADKRTAFSWRRANPVGAMRLLSAHAELVGLSVVNFLMHFSHHVFSAVFVLYAAYRYGWSPGEVGGLLALVGAMDMAVQGLLVGPVVRRMGDRGAMILGLLCGAAGLAGMGLAPTGLLFALAMVPNALWGLAMPTLQSLMTQSVSQTEQGQLQGANMSVVSIAGVASPLFFGAVYTISVGPLALIPHPGAAFLIAAAILAGAGGSAVVLLRRLRAAPART